MPPKRSQNRQKSTEQEGRILLAIQAIQKKEIAAIRAAARIFSVPESTLRARLRGITYRAETRANSSKLTKSEEETLENWIISLDTRGAAPRHKTVRETVDLLLAARDTIPPPTVGGKWVYNFINRHLRICTRFSRRYNYERAKYEDLKIVKGWFNLVRNTILKKGIDIDDIYNFDETGFAMGLIATVKVITRADYYGRASLL